MCQTPLPPPSLHARVISAREQDGRPKSCSGSALQAEETVRRTTSLFFLRAHRSAHRRDAKTPSKGSAMCSPQWPAGAVNWRGGRTAGQRKTGQRKARYGSHQPAATSQQQQQQQQPKKKSTQENAPEPACHSYAKTVRAVLTTPAHAPLRSVPVSGEVLRRTGGLLGVGRAPAGFVGPGVTTCGGGADLSKASSNCLRAAGELACARGCAMGASAGRLQAEVGKNGKVREPRPVWGWWMRSAQRPALSLHGVCLF